MRPASRPSPSARRGFSLVEIMVVVTIISVLAMLSVPAFQRIRRRARSSVIANDFRVFAAAVATYAHEKGTWPAETAAGVCPPVMTSRWNTTAWLRKTPIGGQYNWDNNQNHLGTQITAAISIAATASAPLPLDVNQLTDLERVIDGASYNLLGGSFRLGSGLNPVYVVQP
jgi:prepilin-type N-terminal cleavage/methylation domain-containing protein